MPFHKMGRLIQNLEIFILVGGQGYVQVSQALKMREEKMQPKGRKGEKLMKLEFLTLFCHMSKMKSKHR